MHAPPLPVRGADPPGRAGGGAAVAGGGGVRAGLSCGGRCRRRRRRGRQPRRGIQRRHRGGAVAVWPGGEAAVPQPRAAQPTAAAGSCIHSPHPAGSRLGASPCADASHAHSRASRRCLRTWPRSAAARRAATPCSATSCDAASCGACSCACARLKCSPSANRIHERKLCTTGPEVRTKRSGNASAPAVPRDVAAISRTRPLRLRPLRLPRRAARSRRHGAAPEGGQ